VSATALARRATACLACFAWLVCAGGRVFAQPAPDVAPAGPVLALEEFTRRVAAHHPAVRQARLGVEQAREEQRIAVGGFDPTVVAGWDRKTFGTVAYYDYVAAALTIPTPLGVDVKLGYERTAGRYASLDRRTPPAGLVTAGLSIPLGQRVVTDERRTAIAVARALRNGADADRDATANRVLLQATRDYARWFEGERRASVAQEGVSLADFRLGAVRRRVAAGEAAPLDTVEALLEVHRRRVLLVEAVQSALAARLTAEAHLWDAHGLPDTLPTGAVPSAEVRDAAVPDSAAVARWVATAARAHPELQRAEARVAQAAAQRRLAAQQVLPLAALDVASLGTAGGPLAPAVSPLDDLKLGLAVRAPLLYLRERGRAGVAGVRLEQQQVERDRARREVLVAARIAVGEVRAVSEAAAAQRAAVEQARLLLHGEQRRFEAGESTLFVVNQRERALLDERLRLVGLDGRALAARAELATALGTWPWSRSVGR
jgi:outer membrane protein TolC